MASFHLLHRLAFVCERSAVSGASSAIIVFGEHGCREAVALATRVIVIGRFWIGADYDGMDSQPEGLDDVSKYPALFAELLRRGYSEGDVQKIAGRNVLRAMRGAETVAQRLQKARPPSLATIDAIDGPAK